MIKLKQGLLVLVVIYKNLLLTKNEATKITTNKNCLYHPSLGPPQFMFVDATGDVIWWFSACILIIAVVLNIEF